MDTINGKKTWCSVCPKLPKWGLPYGKNSEDHRAPDENYRVMIKGNARWLLTNLKEHQP